MSSRITIQLIGSPSDKKDVRINDFIEQLKNVKKALRETELAISGQSEAALDYKIVDLRHSSPSTVVLEPILLDPGRETIVELKKRVVDSFTTELRLIKREKKLLIAPELPRLEAYLDIGKRDAAKSMIETVKIRSGRTVVTIDKAFKRNLEDIVGPDEFAEGTISGMLEAVNFHNVNKFTLYPILGAKKIAGTFDGRLRPSVKQAIGSYVTVIGKLRYKAWSPYPHGVIAEMLDVHEAESELPTLTEMRGVLGGSTAPLNSAEFVDQLRHEDW